MAFLLKDKTPEFIGVSIKSQSAAISGIHWLGTLSVYFKYPFIILLKERCSL